MNTKYILNNASVSVQWIPRTYCHLLRFWIRKLRDCRRVCTLCPL